MNIQFCCSNFLCNNFMANFKTTKIITCCNYFFKLAKWIEILRSIFTVRVVDVCLDTSQNVGTGWGCCFVSRATIFADTVEASIVWMIGAAGALNEGLHICSQFHQHFTHKPLVWKCFRQLSLVTFWLWNFLAQKYWQKSRA